MGKHIKLAFACGLVALGLFSAVPVLAGSQVADFLCENGISLYQSGLYEDALREFDKALMADPDNQTAKKYISRIFQQQAPAAQAPAAGKIDARQEIIRSALDSLDRQKALPEPTKIAQAPPGKNVSKEAALLEFSGEVRLGLGITSDDVIWKDANADYVGVPREKNWRYLWGEKRENTYDPKIYDRLRLGMQTKFDSPLNAFVEVAADPWVYIGKNKVHVSSGADNLDLDLKYWSSDHRTINETYRSDSGQVVNLKQIKVTDGKTTVTRLQVAPTNAPFGAAIQPMDIKRAYRPLRKFWLDYEKEGLGLKVFPLSNQEEALTSDDPLQISNNRVYWEESPWLDAYEPSRAFTSAGNPIKKGKWVRSLSYFTRDSSDDYPHRLTFLRGASFKQDTGTYSLEAAAATPMSLWDNYNNSNSVDAAARLKIPLGGLQLGLVSATKMGLDRGSLDAVNQAEAIDLNYRAADLNFYGEAAVSHTDIQEAKDFSSRYQGAAAKVGIDYDVSGESRSGINRGGFFYAHLDKEFYPGLSNYRYTRRDDPTISRHIYFSAVNDNDKPLAWGNGIDRGRNVLGFNLGAAAFNEKLDSDFKYRTVTASSGKYVESVLRSESTYQVTPRLVSKFLAYYQRLPLTHAGIEPVIYNKTLYSLTDYFSDDDEHPANAAIEDGKDPSIGAFDIGAKYGLVEGLVSVEGIYERTNDPEDFPRGLLNDLSVKSENKDGQLWDKVEPFLYDQRFFALPPYPYYNIAKTKLIYTPSAKLEFILSYTFNENKHATGINDNINHAGFEATYKPGQKCSFWFKYVYSRLIDVYKQNQFQKTDFFEGHSNIFFGSRYDFNPDESFTLLYGEFVGYDDPYQQTNWSLTALDTQHTFRLIYRRKF